MNKNSDAANNQQNKLIENLAKNLASKRPKETNFNNTKTRKYFGKNTKEIDQNSNTLMDSLILNQIGSSISTNNKTDSVNITACKFSINFFLFFIKILFNFYLVSKCNNLSNNLPPVGRNIVTNDHQRKPSKIIRVSKNIVRIKIK